MVAQFVRHVRSYITPLNKILSAHEFETRCTFACGTGLRILFEDFYALCGICVCICVWRGWWNVLEGIHGRLAGPIKNIKLKSNISADFD